MSSTVDLSLRRSLHLKGLQVAYSDCLEIIDDTSHVAVYRFINNDLKWERMDIEGSAYITRNSSSPLFSILVLNRKGTDDLVIHILENLDKIQLQEQYIMMRCTDINRDTAILGIWIHDNAERTRIYESIKRIKSRNQNKDSMNHILSKLSMAVISTSQEKSEESKQTPQPVRATHLLSFLKGNTNGDDQLGTSPFTKTVASAESNSGSSQSLYFEEIKPMKATVDKEKTSNLLSALKHANQSNKHESSFQADKNQDLLTDHQIASNIKLNKIKPSGKNELETATDNSQSLKDLSEENSSKLNSLSSSFGSQQFSSTSARLSTKVLLISPSDLGDSA